MAEPSKKHLLHLIPKLGHGGAEHQLLHNLRLLDRDRFRNSVCYLKADGPLIPAFRDLGVELFCLADDGASGWPSWITGLRHVVAEHGVDLIHATNADAWVLGGIVGRLDRVPVAMTLNNTFYDAAWLVDNPKLNRFKLWYSRTRTGLALKHGCTARFLAISKHVKQTHVERLGIPEEKIEVVYRGVPDSFFEPVDDDLADLRSELDVAEAFPILLSVARLVPQKGQRHLIRAMPEILRDFPKAKLLLVGVGFQESELRAMVTELGLDEHISFLGARTDVRELHALSDMFLFPSNYEGYGAALGEALATGNACVVTGVPPLTELVEHGSSGLHVPPRDPAAVAEAVKTLSGDDELRRRLGAGAHDRATRNFTIHRSVRGHARFYEEILASAG